MANLFNVNKAFFFHKIALGFGVSGGLGEAEVSGMDCKCARQYQEGLKLGCRMTIHLSDYLKQEDFNVSRNTQPNTNLLLNIYASP